MIDPLAYDRISKTLAKQQVTLVAVSKTKPVSDIQALYALGQRDFGENYVQELVEKQSQLPADIRWHFIGHLQRNKVRMIAPFVHLIHGVDSLRLLETINKEGERAGRRIDCLLQIHIASEETKFGWDASEITDVFRTQVTPASYPHLRIRGLMGMASFSDDPGLVRSEFRALHSLFLEMKSGCFAGIDYFDVISMGMSADHPIAVEEGSNMVRIGSLLFGNR
jgi:pyridoxal phosphate enzyme (YggS family)